jgi:chromosome partitioning protein
MELTSPLSATVQTFEDWSNEIEIVCRKVQSAASSPRDFGRVLRRFRFSDVSELSEITRYQWRQWTTNNKDTLSHYKNNERGDITISLGEFRRMLDDYGLIKKRPKGAKTMRLLTQQFKGGSQKSSVSLHVAQYLCLAGHRVLIIDTDPQGTLSRYMGIHPDLVENENTIGVIFDHMVEPNDAGLPELKPLETHFEGLDIIPANLAMSGADIDIAASLIKGEGKGEPFYRPLGEAIANIEENYDVIIIDSPPAFSFMAICLAWCSDGLIIPVPGEVPDLAATGDFCKLFSYNMKLAEGLEKVQKVWEPVLFLHGRNTSSEGSAFVLENSSVIFRSHHVKSVIKQSMPVVNCLSSLMSVFEASSLQSDIRGLKSAREMYMALGADVERGIVKAWERQIGDKPNGNS